MTAGEDEYIQMTDDVERERESGRMYVELCCQVVGIL